MYLKICLSFVDVSHWIFSEESHLLAIELDRFQPSILHCCNIFFRCCYDSRSCYLCPSDTSLTFFFLRTLNGVCYLWSWVTHLLDLLCFFIVTLLCVFFVFFKSRINFFLVLDEFQLIKISLHSDLKWVRFIFLRQPSKEKSALTNLINSRKPDQILWPTYLQSPYFYSSLQIIYQIS